MEKILLLVHTDATGLDKSGLEALSHAVELKSSLSDSELIVGLVGGEVDKAARAIASCGAKRFLGVSGEGFSVPRYASDKAAAEALIRCSEATLVLAPATSRWLRSIAGACLRVGGRIDSHVSSISVSGAEVGIKRWFYRQRMEGELTRSSRPWCMLLDAGTKEPWTGSADNAEVETVPVELADPRTSFIGYREPSSGEQTIRPDAELLFVAGAGWTKKQPDGKTHVSTAAEQIMAFVKHTGASLGSSKSLVDMDSEGQGVLPCLSHMNQVGQTGSSPRHPKGLATCCHGEEPHVVGWRFINDRRAINLDANCGWAQGKADVLYVADAFEVMEKVNALLVK